MNTDKTFVILLLCISSISKSYDTLGFAIAGGDLKHIALLTSKSWRTGRVFRKGWTLGDGREEEGIPAPPD
jgi:hypothetical protein